MSEGPAPAGRARAWGLVPFAAFAALAALTWKRWFLPFQDHPRELMTGLRLADGEVLYRDVGYYYGPLPPYLDAAAYRLFGRHLDVLLGLRLAVALLGVAALSRLARRLFPDDRTAAAAVSFLVAACLFCYGSPWAFPYSAAALEGTVGILWGLELALASRSPRGSLAAGLVAGLAAASKVELVPAAVLVTAPALLLRRPRREALRAALLAGGVACATLALPILLLGAAAVSRHGLLLALHTPGSWKHFYDAVFFGGMSQGAFLSRGVVSLLFPSVPFALAAWGVVRAGSRRSPAGVVAAFALGLASLAIAHNEELNVLLLTGAAAACVSAVRLARAPDRATSPWLAPACVGLVLLLFVWRQPFFLRIGVYTAFSAPLALLVALAFLTRGGVPARAAALLAGLALAQGVDRWRDYHAFPVSRVSFPRGSFYLPRETASLVEDSVAAVRKLAPPGGTVWAFPEPGFLTFFGERRSAFVDEQFHTGQQAASTEQDMIDRLSVRPPDVALLTNRTLDEFGSARFGHGVLDRFEAALHEHMRPVGFVGADRPIPGMGMATQALVLVPARP